MSNINKIIENEHNMLNPMTYKSFFKYLFLTYL